MFRIPSRCCTVVRWVACSAALASTLASVALAQSGGDSLATLTTPPEPAATLAPPAPGSAAALTNPAISVIGWFQAVSGNDPAAQTQAFALRESELGFQAAVDPFTRADFFMSASAQGLDVEEGYITWIALPGGAQAKIGKFRADLGKFNRTHPPETPFADRPLAAAAFLGEEGLATTGGSLSALVPNPLGLYWDVVANVGNVPNGDASPLFEPSRRSDLLAVGRSSVFVPFGVSADMNLGVSYANATAGSALRDAEGNRAQIGAADLTAHWKNPRRSIYRSLFVQGELLAERGSRAGAPRRTGGYGYATYQFARQWKLGGRYDWTEYPGSNEHESGGLVLLAYQPSEFSTLSVQGRRVSEVGRDRDSAFFKWTFNIGPHGAHPY